ncbi:MAG: ATP-grasp domain-containing protein [Actinomycetota bacterium]|nr:ATP-grasp domain-containing protein [Actinomycetota bacterium]
MERNGSVALVVGPGPVMPAQGTWLKWQAARLCALLRRAGHRVLVLEDDPSTLMDLGAAGDDLYVEPPLPEVVEAIAESRGVSSIWYGAGGRRAGALASRLSAEGVHHRLGVTTPGWDDRAWWTCGDRSLLREALESGGIANPRGQAVRGMGEAQAAADRLGFPLVARAYFSEGGRGTGLAYNREDYQELVEKALRESLTGELLVEEALEGWTKFVALVMRDEGGEARVAGMLEQLSPLTMHEGDAVLVAPPRSAGREAAYALGEMALRAAEVAGLTGVSEVKLAASPAWEEIYVLDINPAGGSSLALMETLLGADLVRAQALLAMGAGVEEAAGRVGREDPRGFLVAVPVCGEAGEDGGEGPLWTARRSDSWRAWVADSPARAASLAREYMERKGGGCRTPDPEGWQRLREMSDKEKEAGNPSPTWRCVTRPAGGLSAGGLMFLDGGTGEGGGHDRQAGCLRAAFAAREMGLGTALYTPDPGLAMLAAVVMDAVFIGELHPEEVASAARELGCTRLVAHYGGDGAASCAREAGHGGLEVLGAEELLDAERPAQVLERLRSAGLPVVDFYPGREGCAGPPEGLAYPLHVQGAAGGRVGTTAIAFTPREAERLASEMGARTLWRSLDEETREVRVEAVGGPRGCLAVLVWEQLGAAGLSPGEGMAVFPPVSLTTQQRLLAAGLARGAVEALGWRGNLSLRLAADGEGMRIWSAESGASEDLSFLERASGVPLAHLGICALLGEEGAVAEEAHARVSVRVPLPPGGDLAYADILPTSPRRTPGSVMGTAPDYGTALGKALVSLGIRPRLGGAALLSVANRDKRRAVLLARELVQAGYRIMATRGTAHTLSAAGLEVETVRKLREGRPNILDHIRNGEVSLVVNIPRGRHPHCDGFYIREASVRYGVPCVTSMEAAMALAVGLREAAAPPREARALSEYLPAAGRAGGR